MPASDNAGFRLTEILMRARALLHVRRSGARPSAPVQCERLAAETDSPSEGKACQALPRQRQRGRASELGDNGDFEGFRYATRAEILDLFDQFGFVDFQSPALNTSVFFALFGVTSMQDGNPEAMSWGADALTADWIFGLDYFLGNGPGYRVYAGDQLWQNPTIAFASTGSFLVVVPEPTIVTLVGIGFLGACAAKRRGRKRVRQTARIQSRQRDFKADRRRRQTGGGDRAPRHRRLASSVEHSSGLRLTHAMATRLQSLWSE